MSESVEPKVPLSRIVVPGNRLLVRQLDPATKTAGGIILPEPAQKVRTVCQVLKIGRLITAEGKAGVNEAAIGDEVIVSKHCLNSASVSELGDEFFVIDPHDILCIIKPENAHVSDPATAR